mgnify:CR=1 FL=1
MKYSPDPFFNPDLQDHILPRTKLAPGITISKSPADIGKTLFKKLNG